MSEPLRLNPALDVAALRDEFTRAGRLQILDVLETASARRIHAALEAARDWVFVFNRGNKHFELTAENAARMPREAHVEMQRDILANARDGFQLAYEVLNVSKKTAAVLTDNPVLVALHAFMNSPELIGFLREVTGETRGAWCDVTATRYRPGQFCEAHDDKADDGERLIAYVMNLTPRWRVDWGGLLLFIDERGNVSRGLTPTFNALNIFRTPQQHSVSQVAPFAGANRLSITGWLRPEGG